MWNSCSYETLTPALGVPVEVDWDRKPSAGKYGKVNTLLAALSYFQRQGGVLLDLDGKELSTLIIRPMKRKLTNSKKRVFTIVGHSTGHPMLVVRAGALHLEVYFNYHLFVETETTYRQHYPSASVIVRCRNFLQSTLVPSPGSWGSDIIGMTYDWEGTLIIETAQYGITGQIRRNFRGYKLVPTNHKHFVTSRQPPKRETVFLENNGFKSVVAGMSMQDCIPRIDGAVRSYVMALERRYRESRTGRSNMALQRTALPRRRRGPIVGRTLGTS